MKKTTLTLTVVLAATLLVACGKKDAKTEAAAGEKPTASATQAASKKAEDQPRPATYDPNLKPAQIVWDSPEKQKAWEARQAELKKSAQKGQ